MFAADVESISKGKFGWACEGDCATAGGNSIEELAKTILRVIWDDRFVALGFECPFPFHARLRNRISEGSVNATKANLGQPTAEPTRQYSGYNSFAGCSGMWRKRELDAFFRECSLPRVYVSAFPNPAEFKRHIYDIAWETEVWIAEMPDHLIHFNGNRLLGPHK